MRTLMSSTKKNSNTFTMLTNSCYLKLWESFPINDTQKIIALELAQNIHYIWPEHRDEGDSDIIENSVLKEYDIKHYGLDVDPVTIVQKGIYSFIVLWSEVGYKDCPCIVPLKCIVEDVYFDYDDYKYRNFCYKEFIINENGQYGVFDDNGTMKFPYIDKSISFVEDALIAISENDIRNIYLVENKLRYYDLYLGDELLYKYISSVVPYFKDDYRYLVVDHYDGQQVYDFGPWLNKESEKPVPLFKKKLEIKGCIPVPTVYSENKMGISNNGDRYGFIEVPSGKLVIPCIYKGILQNYEQGKAKVSIDDHGNYVIIDYKNTILGWGNSYKERLEAEERYFNSNVGDWSFADADLEDFRDNYDY